MVLTRTEKVQFSVMRIYDHWVPLPLNHCNAQWSGIGMDHLKLLASPAPENISFIPVIQRIDRCTRRNTQ